MPEYLAPGVYVEEVSYRAKSIEGLGTTTTGFIGPTRYGPIDIPLDVITSIGEFERTYGDRQQMQFSVGSSAITMHNYMWHAARAFFEQGGTKLYVSRVFAPLASVGSGENPDGKAAASISASPAGSQIKVQARFPGDFGNMHVRITLQLGENVLATDISTGHAGGARCCTTTTSSWCSGHHGAPLPRYLRGPNPTSTRGPASKPGGSTPRTTRQRTRPSSWQICIPATIPIRTRETTFASITATITIYPNDPNLSTWVYSGLALDKNHQINGASDSIEAQFAAQPDSLGEARTIPIVITLDGADDGLSLLAALLGYKSSLQDDLLDPLSTDVERSIDIILEGGNDGDRPQASADDGFGGYEGLADPASTKKTGLKAFEDIDEISIVAAPGSTFCTAAPHGVMRPSPSSNC